MKTPEQKEREISFLLHSYGLDGAGIQWEVRNEAVSQAQVGMPFATELWVLREEDYESARELIQSGTAQG